MRMKKFFLSFFVVLIFAIYVIFQRGGISNYIDITNRNQGSPVPGPSSSTPRPVTSTFESGTVTPKPTASPKVSQGQYKDGEYVGSVAGAYYGNVQVKAVIQGGKITDVQFLDYPHDRNTSREINTQAMPYLTSEAIQAQSAKVDVVSGATETSGAFVESLTSALAQAKN